MLINFKKSYNSELWINTEQITAVQQYDEDKEGHYKAYIAIVLGTPVDVPKFGDDTFMNWAKPLRIEFESTKDCRYAFKMLKDCVGRGSLSI